MGCLGGCQGYQWVTERNAMQVMARVVLLVQREDERRSENEHQDQKDFDALECKDIGKARRHGLIVVLLYR
jgi:hypothetical protein